MLSSARSRAKAKGVPFTITYQDILIPDRCPILGIPLVRGRGRITDNSPSLDRVVPALGYVRGNVQVISMRANRIKSDSNPAELAMIRDWVLRHTPPPPDRRRPARCSSSSGGAPIGSAASPPGATTRRPTSSASEPS